MPKVELSDRFCSNAVSGEGRKVDYFDTLARGLCLRVNAGGAKAFYLVFSNPGDRKRNWYKIGEYPGTSLADARRKAREERSQVLAGNDPIKEERARRASQAVRDLVENYVDRHASALRSGPAIARRLRKNVSEVIGDVKLADLHKRDITKAIDAVMDRDAPIEANRIYSDLSAMIRWACGRGDLDHNLMDGMRKPAAAVVRDRVLSDDEIKTMWKALETAEMREGTRRVLRLCLITGQRVGEVCGMTLDEVDLDRATWTIPAERVKNKRSHLVPLSRMALDVIHEQLTDVALLAGRKGREVPPFVFPGPGARAAMTAAAVAKAVKREEITKRGIATIIGIDAWTPHDLRRTAATKMEEMGISPFEIAHVLNHASIAQSTITSRVYARHTYEQEKREALDRWAERLQAVISGRAAAIVPFGRGAA